ncbi:pretranslocase subunit SecB family protein, partial [Bacteroides fragilis str. S13 L11]
LAEIPNFFYPNSIAILFPYVRAFVSTLTLQANIKPILLPTLNLSSLQDTLRENTTTK